MPLLSAKNYGEIVAKETKPDRLKKFSAKIRIETEQAVLTIDAKSPSDKSKNPWGSFFEVIDTLIRIRDSLEKEELSDKASRV